MPAPEPSSCKNCKFWKRISDKDGYCVRYASMPQVFVGEKTPERPKTKEEEWCGDYQKN